MQGLVLIGTFVVLALVALTVATFIGLVVDNLPHLHDMLSLLTFFGAVIVLLPVAWVIAVRLTEPRTTA